MRDKYKDKPEQLAAIMENSRKIFCPIRKVRLYADPTYFMRASEAESTSRQQKKSIEQEMTMKPSKKKKVAEKGSETSLGKSELAKLARHKDAVMKACFELETGQKRAMTVGAQIPPFLMAKQKQHSAFCKQVVAEIEFIIDNKNGDFSTAEANARKAVETSTRSLATLTTFVEEFMEYDGKAEDDK